MSEQPRYGAPSPADGPTTPGTGAVSRADLSGAGGVRGDVPRGKVSRGDVSRDRGGGTGEERTPPADRPTIPDGGAEAARPRPRVSPGRTRVGGTWIALLLGAVVLVFLLVFILQNLDPARVAFLGLEATLPLGIWLLFAAVAGMLLLAIPGLGRMLQWRRAARGTGRGRS